MVVEQNNFFGEKIVMWEFEYLKYITRLRRAKFPCSVFNYVPVAQPGKNTQHKHQPSFEKEIKG